MQRCLLDDKLNRFNVDLIGAYQCATDRRMDRQTDRIAISISRSGWLCYGDPLKYK